jgi:hypothetical protein
MMGRGSPMGECSTYLGTFSLMADIDIVPLLPVRTDDEV